jgi:hypothetical protein
MQAISEYIYEVKIYVLNHIRALVILSGLDEGAMPRLEKPLHMR